MDSLIQYSSLHTSGRGNVPRSAAAAARINGRRRWNQTREAARISAGAAGDHLIMATNGTRQGEGEGDVDAGLVYSNAAGLGSLSRNQEKALSLPARFELKSWPLSPSRCSVLPLLCPVWCKLVYCLLILSRNSTGTAARVPDQ
jgi:hypothetical protein